uniref:Uncharacterized protein n=1 Tax=Heterorhabditis bacteriophora TaxID=37862 RepID=A0A1I7WBX3_HETBA
MAENGNSCVRRSENESSVDDVMQKNDVLLQYFVVAKCLRSAVEQVNVLERGSIQDEAPEGLVIGPVGEAAGDNRDQLPAIGHLRQRSPNKRRVEVHGLQSDAPRLDARIRAGGNLFVGRVHHAKRERCPALLQVIGCGGQVIALSDRHPHPV